MIIYSQDGQVYNYSPAVSALSDEQYGQLQAGQWIEMEHHDLIIGEDNEYQLMPTELRRYSKKTPIGNN